MTASCHAFQRCAVMGYDVLVVFTRLLRWHLQLPARVLAGNGGKFAGA